MGEGQDDDGQGAGREVGRRGLDAVYGRDAWDWTLEGRGCAGGGVDSTAGQRMGAPLG